MYGMKPRGAPKEADESIYNLISQPQERKARSAMHRSKFPHNTPPTASTFVVKPFATVNVSNVAGEYARQPPTPSNFLYGHPDASTLPPKRGSNPTSPTSASVTRTCHSAGSAGPRQMSQSHFHYTDRRKETLHDHVDGELKDQLERAESVLSGGKSRKNFIAENAIRAITMKPPRDNSVEWHANYMKRPGFGAVPSYLNEVKSEIAAEKAYVAEMISRQREARQPSGPPMRVMAEEERQVLLANLKQKWEEVNRAYQTMTHMVNLDTFGKVRRKEQYEQQLDELERSIDKLSKKVVYVYDDLKQ